MSTDRPTPISCREAVELVTEYVEGTLGPDGRAAFEGHLGCCDWCRAYLEQIRITLRVVGEVPPEPVDPAVERELLDLFRKLTKGDEG
jgi:anti-sigma factor RsiW